MIFIWRVGEATNAANVSSGNLIRGGENGGVEKIREGGDRKTIMSVETGSSYNGGQRSGHQAVA